MFISLKEEGKLKTSRSCGVCVRVCGGKYVCPHVPSPQPLNLLTDIHGKCMNVTSMEVSHR